MPSQTCDRLILSWSLAGMLVPGIGWADATVHQGWGLYETQPGTMIDGVSLVGVPLGTYDFGSGTVSVGLTDTIIARTGDATVTGSVPPPKTATVGLQLAAFQLETATTLIFPGDSIGSPTHYFITLQSDRGGPASTGSLSITFVQPDQGNFASSMDVFFDVRRGSLNGPIVASQDIVLSNNGKAWKTTDPSFSGLLLPGVNFMLDGSDSNEDFWPTGELVLHDPSTANLAIVPTAVPEPWQGGVVGSIALIGLALSRKLFRTGPKCR